jgi:hypothetical protein
LYGGITARYKNAPCGSNFSFVTRFQKIDESGSETNQGNKILFAKPKKLCLRIVKNSKLLIIQKVALQTNSSGSNTMQIVNSKQYKAIKKNISPNHSNTKP